MRVFSKTSKTSIFVVFLGLGVLATSMLAFALPANQVHRSLNPIIVTGPCCQDITGETVTVTEPAKVASVVVEWSMEYVASGPFAIGLRINGGGCGDYGPESLPKATAVNGTPFYPATIQWVILPTDGLVVGKNTFTLCEGPTVNNGDQMTIGTRTLLVSISK